MYRTIFDNRIFATVLTVSFCCALAALPATLFLSKIREKEKENGR